MVRAWSIWVQKTREIEGEQKQIFDTWEYKLCECGWVWVWGETRQWLDAFVCS